KSLAGFDHVSGPDIDAHDLARHRTEQEPAEVGWRLHRHQRHEVGNSGPEHTRHYISAPPAQAEATRNAVDPHMVQLAVDPRNGERHAGLPAGLDEKLLAVAVGQPILDAVGADLEVPAVGGSGPLADQHGAALVGAGV